MSADSVSLVCNQKNEQEEENSTEDRKQKNRHLDDGHLSDEYNDDFEYYWYGGHLPEIPETKFSFENETYDQDDFSQYFEDDNCEYNEEENYDKKNGYEDDDVNFDEENEFGQDYGHSEDDGFDENDELLEKDVSKNLSNKSSKEVGETPSKNDEIKKSVKSMIFSVFEMRGYDWLFASSMEKEFEKDWGISLKAQLEQAGYSNLTKLLADFPKDFASGIDPEYPDDPMIYVNYSESSENLEETNSKTEPKLNEPKSKKDQTKENVKAMIYSTLGIRGNDGIYSSALEKEFKKDWRASLSSFLESVGYTHLNELLEDFSNDFYTDVDPAFPHDPVIYPVFTNDNKNLEEIFTTEPITFYRKDYYQPAPRTTVQKFFCELCHVTCSDAVQFDLHMNGQKHAKREHLNQCASRLYRVFEKT